jgi:hypothetical protein
MRVIQLRTDKHMLRKLGVIFLTAAIWSLAWGIAGAVAGAVMTVFHPDTGHIPADKIPLLIGLPSALFGSIGGLLYSSLAAALGAETRSGMKVRTILGAGIGGIAGLIFMKLLAHSYLTILVAVLLGALLARSSLLGRFQQTNSKISVNRGT